MSESETPREQQESKDGTSGLRIDEAWVLGFGSGAVVIGLMILAYVIGYNRGQHHPVAGAKVPAAKTATAPAVASGPGQQLFASTCGRCHTLSAAGTSGTVGPNLDQLKPSETQVLAAIKNGGLGSGTMPPNLYTGAQAQQVAAFVAGSAGR